MNENRKKEVDAWIKGVKNEVSYWNNNVENFKFGIESKREELVLEGVEKTEIEKILYEENPMVLDVGCGLLYKYGDFFRGEKLDFHRIDPLAFLYNDILTKKKIKMPLIEFGMLEYLYGFYKRNQVSLIIISNALDHSYNPICGISSALSVLKKGGMLYLYHNENEAENENYHGFHQFNFTIEENDLICWNRESRVNINEKFQHVASIETIKTRGKVIISKIIKRKDIELDDNISDLCEQLMYVISKFLEPKFILIYLLKYEILNIYTKIKKINPKLFNRIKIIIRKVPLLNKIEVVFK